MSEFVPEVLSLLSHHRAFLADVQCASLTFPGMIIFQNALIHGHNFHEIQNQLVLAGDALEDRGGKGGRRGVGTGTIQK